LVTGLQIHTPAPSDLPVSPELTSSGSEKSHIDAIWYHFFCCCSFFFLFPFPSARTPGWGGMGAEGAGLWKG